MFKKPGRNDSALKNKNKIKTIIAKSKQPYIQVVWTNPN